MSQYQLVHQYVSCRLGAAARRIARDEQGAVTAEHIVAIGAAVVGAAIVGGIIWSKMQDGANSIQTPAP